MKTVDEILAGLPEGTTVTTFGPGALYDTAVIKLPIVFPVARDNCYCPTCAVWYDCASNAHAGH